MIKKIKIIKMSSNNELFKINETGNIHNFITHKIVNNWSI